MASSSSSENGKKSSSSSKKRYSIEFLPEDLMLKIFVLLPVITLLRCKSVCKSWLSLILNPQFVETHLIESQKRQPLSLLKVTEDQFYIDTDHETSSLLQLPQHFIDMIHISPILSSCNGLVCLANARLEVIYLWNPMTRQFKKLPTPRNIITHYTNPFVLGFGYDDFSNDYRVLRISFKSVYSRYKEGKYKRSMNVERISFKSVYSSYKEGKYNRSMYVEMYSANEDSWKEIEVPKTLEFFRIYRSPHEGGVFLPQTPGVLYFEGYFELLSFDLHNEVFRVYPYHIPGTHAILSEKKPRLMSRLLNFEGSLAMIYDESIDDGESIYNLWTFSGDCGNTSWTKQFNLENSLKNDRVVLLYLGDGQFVVAEIYSYVPFFYYYKNKLAKKFLPVPPGKHLQGVVKYNESLVSLKGFQQVE